MENVVGCGVANDREERMSEQNRDLARRVFDEAFNQGRLCIIEELCAPDIVLHSPTLTELGRGRGPIKAFVGGLRAGFPDLQIEIDDIITEGDKVVIRWHTTRQTHTGPYQGLPPTGRQVRMTGIDIFRIADGQIVEVWVEIDAVGGLRQMGVLPPPGLGVLARARFMVASLARMAYLEARHVRRQRKR